MLGLYAPPSLNTPFRLRDQFVDTYASRPVPFGFGTYSEVVYLRTYSRLMEDGRNERWHETVRRVVEGTYRMQQRWIQANHLHWNPSKAQQSAEQMYDRMFEMKFLPPGRGLWAMGSPLTEERGLYAALNNCAFVSTHQLAIDLADPFTFLMDASMLGIGVGFDVRGRGSVRLQTPEATLHEYVIPDSREGWVESVRRLLLGHLAGAPVPRFNYSAIRPAGLPINGFGGISAGPEPLQELHEQIHRVLAPDTGRWISTRNIVDVQNLIGKCVVAGNVRRTAEIAFGSPDDEEFLHLKNYDRHPERADYGWTSNNSVFAEFGQDYTDLAARMASNGEPGVAWLRNMREFGRMNEPRDYRDMHVMGANPCAEQSLESYELCCLVETVPERHDNEADFLHTLKFAYLYGKTVTLGNTPWPRTNAVMLRNRRIGLSQTGIDQAIEKFGIERYRQLCESGYDVIREYDRTYSRWFAIPESIKVTSVKPSGTLSAVLGCTAGKHWATAEYMIRRMRISRLSELVAPLVAAGYPVEPCVGDPMSVVVEFPIHQRVRRTVDQVSMWEQLARAAFLQAHWADNQVSSTVSFDPVTEGPQIAEALSLFQYHLKAISFLPRLPEGAYAQMPEEAITAAEYHRRVASLAPVTFALQGEEAEFERFCSNDTCTTP